MFGNRTLNTLSVYLLAVVAVCLVAAFASGDAFASAEAFSLPFLIGMPSVRPTRPKTNADLQNSVTPLFPGQPEMLPWTLFDSATYTSGTTVTMALFGSVQSDNTLGNMDAAGQLPDPQYFDIYHIGVNFQLPIAVVNSGNNNGSGLATNAINDAYGLANGNMRLEIAQKPYHITKISLCPWGGGINAAMCNVGTLNAPNADIVTFPTNGIPYLKNRNCFWGMLTIPPKQTVKMILSWTAALTLANGNTTVMAAMDGYLYRRVL